MYILGELITNNTFKSIYAVFEDELALNTYHKKYKNELDKVTINLSFPFFIIEEFEGDKRYYKSISKDELKNRIQKIKELEDSKFVYFNLWRMDKNTYNENFPNEPILRGIDFHIHFTDTDINEIETNGFEAYWNEVITP